MLSLVFANPVSLRRVVAGLAVLSALVAPALAAAQTETFETKNYGGSCQNAGGSEIGYIGDKEWVGFKALDLVNYRTTCGFGTANGYGALGSSVGSVLALGAGSAYVHSINPFKLNSMLAGAGWQDPTMLTLQSYLNGALLDTRQISLNTSQNGLSLYTGFYAGATDFIMFTPTYPPVGNYSGDTFGSHSVVCPVGAAAGCNGRYESWFVDNLSFSPMAVVVTPEPASVAMLGAGLLALGLAARKRRKA